MKNADNLVVRLKEHSTRRAAFNELVALYRERLYWHIRKMVMNHEDANDILQNVFVKVWRSIDSFREESSLYTWLFRIATNESITYINQLKKKNSWSLSDEQQYLQENLKDDPYFDGNEVERILEEAILSLPEKQRLVFNMKYYEEMKYQQMAEILDTSVGALKASYHHAVKKIEAFVENREID